MSKGHVAIAIDGPAASGKSTLARELSQRFGLIMVNSGAMYRAVTWKIIQLGIDPADEASVIEALGKMDLHCGVENLESTIRIDGQDPGEELRSEAVNLAVSAVSAIPEVRRRLVELQRGYLDFADVVMEGRDIGTVVFPDTPFKIYVDADATVREERRVVAGEIDAVAERDRQDSGRATAPLRIADGAAILDTSGHTIETGVAEAIRLLREQGLELGK
ncbi:MAG: (d)CMP kinase [Akkermansiaceae bacterium]|jgi:cytidylate kinase|nr:(d)CMP kinase [Akkermansiaceae bacterium]